MQRKRPKSLETNVYNKLRQLELYAYVRGDQWKKSYRYTLIDEFRKHITLGKIFEIAPDFTKITIKKEYSTETYYKQQYKLLKRQLKSSTP